MKLTTRTKEKVKEKKLIKKTVLRGLEEKGGRVINMIHMKTIKEGIFVYNMDLNIMQGVDTINRITRIHQLHSAP